MKDMKHVDKLNAPILTINQIKKLISKNILNTIKAWENNIDIEKQCFHIIGPAGVGKTQICQQIADDLTEKTGNEFDTIIIKAPVLSRDDFIIPWPVNEKKEDGFSSFRMLYSDFVPKDENSYGLFVIDEMARGDHNLQQLLWQIQNECSIHKHQFPKGWFVITIDNPDDQEYSMDYIEDAAGLRRALHLFTEVSVRDFLDHAIKNKFHSSIIEYIQSHPQRLYDFDSQKIGSIFANPASWERLSNILIGYDNNGGIKKNINDIIELSAGLLNLSAARLFVDFLQDMDHIKPQDIFNDYKSVKHIITECNKEGNHSKLSTIMFSFMTYLTTSCPDYNEHNLENVKDFLLDIPIDTASIFITQVDSFDRRDPAFRYITKMHSVMVSKFNDYKINFFEKIIRIKDSHSN